VKFTKNQFYLQRAEEFPWKLVEWYMEITDKFLILLVLLLLKCSQVPGSINESSTEDTVLGEFTESH
jgi:hypothetical protein